MAGPGRRVRNRDHGGFQRAVGWPAAVVRLPTHTARGNGSQCSRALRFNPLALLTLAKPTVGIVLGWIGVAAPLVLLFVYCVAWLRSDPPLQGPTVPRCPPRLRDHSRCNARAPSP